MDECSYSLTDTQDLRVPTLPGQHASLVSIAPARAVNSNIFIQNMSAGNQGSVSVTSNTPRPIHPSPRYPSKSRGTSHIEHQSLISDDARPEPLHRKGHTKSRKGCQNCKKRRVKCSENRPVCTQCTRRGLKCEWPELHIGQPGEVTKKSSSIPQQVELPTPIFTQQDFRLFHHFIEDAYPAKPTGNESIWTHEIPSIAHNYNYLLHAMLALSASDLEAGLGQHSFELAQSAMFHRVLAIKSLNRALSTGLNSFEEGNAMLATCYILVYQSTLIDEGLSEYLTFVRGCVLVPLQMGYKGVKFLFQNLLSDDEIEKTRPYLQHMPAIDSRVVDAAYASLEALGPLCERESEKKMREGMLNIVSNFYLSSCDAYLAWLKGSAFFSCHISHAEFLTLINPTNLVGQLLQSHLVAVQTLVRPISPDDRGIRKAFQFLNGMLRWLEVLHTNIEPRMRPYFEWPVKRAEEVREWLRQERTLQKPKDMLNAL